MNNYLRFAALMIFALSAGVAQAINETAEKERNDGGPDLTNPLYEAQVLEPDKEGVIVTPARIGPTGGSTAEDVDYYKFTYHGEPGGQAAFSVVMCASAPQHTSATMALIELKDGKGVNRITETTTKWPRGKPCEDASIATNTLIPGTEYVIAVTDAPVSYFTAIGKYEEPFPSTTNFDYKLVVTGIGTAVTVTDVDILVKPHHSHHSHSLPINLVEGDGKVKVAILGSDDFNIENVDTSSLTFGATGNEAKSVGCKDGRDVNKDGNADLVCSFKVAYTGLTTASTSAVLMGKTTDGGDIKGTGTVKVIASKTHHDHDRDDDDRHDRRHDNQKHKHHR